MKKTYIGYSVLAAVLALSAQQANAQQGFGTDKPSKASVVEMTSGSKGLLIPRVALTSLDSFAPVSGEAPTDVDKTDALLVYNTATSDAAVADEEKVTPGYYYWTTDGTSGKWNRLASDADIPTEPWFAQATNTGATSNIENIYQIAKVGIGSSAPYSALTIVNDNQDDSYDDISIETFGTGGNTPAFIHMAAGGTLASPTSLSNGSFLGSIYFRGFLSDNQYHTLSGIQTKYKGNGTTKLSNMEFYTSNEDADADPKMILTENGNLGIGENNPAQRLEVGSGNVRIHDINTNTGDVTDNVVVADANGVLKTVTAASIASSAEPWKIQNTDTEATDNADNIYQQGKVAVGFTDADGVSDKQLEVKGDFKAQVTDGDIIYGTEVNSPLNPASGMHYWMDGATGNYRVVTAHAGAAGMEAKTGAATAGFAAEATQASMNAKQDDNSAYSMIRTLNTCNFFTETYNVADNYGSTFSLQNDALRLVHSETDGLSNIIADENRSEILLQKENGVRFNFRDEDGDIKGEYWFPTEQGNEGEVLTRVGGNQTDWVSTRDMVAMPKFFYMPSIIVPTSEDQLNAPGSGATAADWFIDATGEGGIDLHARYTAQFGTPMVTNTTQTTTLPTLTATQLDYNITWYDTNVFTSVSVSNTGVLTYTVDDNADVTVGSFMNIVFSVK